MSDEKRTFEASASLLQSTRLQARRAKAKKGTPELISGIEFEELRERDPQPVTQDLILRLIKLLKES
jgi:hypothetical protein